MRLGGGKGKGKKMGRERKSEGVVRKKNLTKATAVSSGTTFVTLLGLSVSTLIL